MITPEGSLKRYTELKESVRVLRAQVRGCRLTSPGGGTHVASTVGPTTDDASGPVMGLEDGTTLVEVDPQESFTVQHMRVQFKIELQVTERIPTIL